MDIVITTSHPELIPQAEHLAAELQIPFTQEPRTAYHLILTKEYLGLQKTSGTSLPVYVDFLSPEMKRRCQQASLKREALARALGLKNKTQPVIIDATAGLARDSFILACLGFEVTLLERSPIIHALVADGLKRAQQDPIVARLHLLHVNAIEWLKTATADLIFLDPMFPEKRKTALSKKNMQFFQDVIGDDEDSEALLAVALTCATSRVVVKRPRLATPIKGPAPSFCLSGSSSRFDVYVRSVRNSPG